jgi:hypothetical protein
VIQLCAALFDVQRVQLALEFALCFEASAYFGQSIHMTGGRSR